MVVISVIIWIGIGIFMILALFYLFQSSTLSIKVTSAVSLVINFLIWLTLTTCSFGINKRGEGEITLKIYVLGALFAGISSGLSILLVAIDDIASGFVIAFPGVLISTLVTLSVTYTENLPMHATFVVTSQLHLYIERASWVAQ